MTYPETPGYQNRETSKDAAKSMISAAGAMKEQIMQIMKQQPDQGLDTYQIAGLLGLDFHQVQPRVSDLLAEGLLVGSGKTNINPLTRRKIEIWRVNPQPGAKPSKKSSRKEMEYQILVAADALRYYAYMFSTCDNGEKARKALEVIDGYVS